VNAATVGAYLDSMVRRIEYIESLPFAHRLRAIKLATHLRIPDPILQQKAVKVCLDQELLTSPIGTFSSDVAQVIDEVLNAK
jgi:hypothetical protein